MNNGLYDIFTPDNNSHKRNKSNKKNKGCRIYTPYFLVIFVIVLISVIYELVTFDYQIFNLDKYVYDYDINSNINYPISEESYTNALQKLENCGLATLSSGFTLENLGESTDEPTSNLNLSQSEFAGLLKSLIYSVIGEVNSIYEISFLKKDENYSFTITYSTNISINVFLSKSNKTIYTKEEYDIIINEDKSYTIIENSIELLNVDEKIKNDDIVKSAKSNYTSFINSVLNDGENTKSLVHILKFSSIQIQNDEVVFLML